MTNVEYGALLFGVCILLVALRMPVAVAMFLVGGCGFISFAGWSAFLNLLNTAPFGRVSSYTLSVLPLFLLMGQLATHAGLSRQLFDATRACIGHRRGGLAMATIGGCAGFSAVCGSSIATGATMASVALPEMRKKRLLRCARNRYVSRGRHIRHPIPTFDHSRYLCRHHRTISRETIHRRFGSRCHRNAWVLGGNRPLREI